MYEHYNLFDFSVPLGKIGDCYDRYLIRLEEMRESLSIMSSCLDYLVYWKSVGCYDYIVNDSKIAPPSRSAMKNSMESLIHHFKIYSEGILPMQEESYTVIEAPKGDSEYYSCRMEHRGRIDAE